MRDGNLDFGAITLGSSSAGYSANSIDFGVDVQDLSNLVDMVLVITATSAVTSAKISLYSGSAANPTTSIHDYASIASMADGDRVELQLPLTCARYLRVGGTGTGSVKAAIEPGGKSAG